MSSIFYGAKVQENKPEVPRITQAAALRITRVSLNPQCSSHKKVSLFIKIKNNSFCIATLEKDKIQDKPLDIYLSNSEVVTFYAKGKGELHLIGYFDPLDFDSDAAFDEQEEEEEEEDEDETAELNEEQNQLLQKIKNQNEIKTVSSKKKKAEKTTTNKKKEDQDNYEDDDDDDEDFQLDDDINQEELAQLQKLTVEKKNKNKYAKEDKKVENELKKAKDNKISNANIPRVVSRNNSEKKPKAQQSPSDSEDLLNDVDDDEDDDDDILVDDDQIQNVISKKLQNKSNLKVENFKGNKKQSIDQGEQDDGDDLLGDDDDDDLLDDDNDDLLGDDDDDDLLDDDDDNDLLDDDDDDLLDDDDDILDSEIGSDQQDDDKIIKKATATQKNKLLGEFRKAVMEDKGTKKAKKAETAKASNKQVLVDNTKKNLPNPAKETSNKPIIGLFAPSSSSKKAQDKKEATTFNDSGQGKRKKKRNKKKNKK